MKTVLLITLKSKYGVLVKMSHFFRYTWDKFDHVLDHHFKTIKAMKVKFCIPVKVIEKHILTINKVYKKLHFLRYLKKKKNLLYFLNYPLADREQTRIVMLLSFSFRYRAGCCSKISAMWSEGCCHQ